MRLSLTGVRKNGKFAACLHLNCKVLNQNLVGRNFSAAKPGAAATSLLHIKILDLDSELLSGFLSNIEAQFDVVSFANDLRNLR